MRRPTLLLTAHEPVWVTTPKVRAEWRGRLLIGAASILGASVPFIVEAHNSLGVLDDDRVQRILHSEISRDPILIRLRQLITPKRDR